MNEELENIHITDVEYMHDYTMNLMFSNGERRIVDFELLLTGKLREPLRDLNNFIQFGLTEWTLEWYNGVDFAPDFLYKVGKAA